MRESLDALGARRGDLLREAFAQLPRVHCPPSEAAFYAWFAVEGVSDSYGFASEILHEARVGLAPGAAFGAEGEGWLRLCHAVAPQQMARALERLAPALE